MYSQTFNIGAYTPILADEQSGKLAEQLAVVDGENFAWRGSAVFSAHGHYQSAPPLPAWMRHPYIARIQDTPYYFCANGVYTWDEASATWQQEFAYAETYTHATWNLDLYKWTYAFVGTRHWFCHPRVGLVYYDQFDDEWGLFRDDCWTGPTYAVTQADLRLVVLLEDTVIWSKIDEGHIFDCGWHCGSGAQSLAKIRYGQPYSVMPYNNGWLTFTSTGVMASMPEMQQVADPDGQRIAVGPLVYRHSVATFDKVLIGPTAVTHIDETRVIWLSMQGFVQFAPTQGGGFGAVQPFEPAMSLFYHDALLSNAAGNWEDHFCLEYTRDQNWLFVSSRSEAFSPYYDRAHFLQLDVERWGSFDFPHTFPGFRRHHDSVLLEDTHWAFLDEQLAVQFVDNRPHTNAWVRFSPQRLQAPNEPELPASTVTSVQEIRIGCSQPVWQQSPTAGLRSSWLSEKKSHTPPSHFDLLIASGWDGETQNVDELEYATLLDRSEHTALFKAHSTGITHTLMATTDRPERYFHLDHIEMTFFLAGVR